MQRAFSTVTYTLHHVQSNMWQPHTYSLRSEATFDDDKCITKTKCGKGEYLRPDSNASSAVEDYDCAECADEVSFQDMDGHIEPACIPCTPACEPGLFIGARCTREEDTQCKRCQSCSPGTYLDGCRGSSEVAPTCRSCLAFCAECINGTTCSRCIDGKVLAADQAVCGDTCPEGEFVPEGTATCVHNCKSGQEVSATSPVSGGVCMDCRQGTIDSDNNFLTKCTVRIPGLGRLKQQQPNPYCCR